MVSPVTVPPGSGLEQAKDRDPTPVIPAGTAAAECPEEEEPPAWEAPAAQIPQRAPSPQDRRGGRLTTRRHEAAKQTSPVTVLQQCPGMGPGVPSHKTLSFLSPVDGRPPERPAVLTCVAETGALSPDGGDQAPRPAVLP